MYFYLNFTGELSIREWLYHKKNLPCILKMQGKFFYTSFGRVAC